MNFCRSRDNAKRLLLTIANAIFSRTADQHGKEAKLVYLVVPKPAQATPKPHTVALQRYVDP